MAQVRLGSARMDENGKAHGGKAGDQNGKELSIQPWYKHSKGWRVLRPKDPEAAEKIAVAMGWACANPNIGYDQYQRLTLYNAAKPHGFNPSKFAVTKKCETDCSALVRVCCGYAGITVGDFTTANEARMLLATGAFTEMTGSKYTNQPNYLMRGDVLVTRSKGHTVVVLDNGDLEQGAALEGATPRTLKKGMAGEDVRQLQNLLMGQGYALPKYGADGDFGAETETALKAWQKAQGLVADGVYGPDSRAAMNAETEIAPPESPDKPAPNVILDMSEYNRTVYWGKLAGECALLILRASIGMKKDAKYAEYAAKAAEKGIPCGAYHYLKAVNADAAREEAQVFYKAAQAQGPAFWVLDAEYGGIKPGKARAITSAFLDELRGLADDKKIGIYIGHHLYEKWNCDYAAFDFVWIPRYGKNNGKVDKAPAYPCDLHQYTSRGKISGAAGEVDLNRLMAGRTVEWFLKGVVK